MKKFCSKWISIVLIATLVWTMSGPAAIGEAFAESSTGSTEEVTVVSTGQCGVDMYWTFYSDGLLKFTGTGYMEDYYPEYNLFPPWPSAKVTRAEFDDGIESVGDCAFSLCGDLNSVKLPANLKRIGDYAFVNCVNLKTITLPEGLAMISEYAFSGCTSLCEINIPDSVTIIEKDAFAYCDSLEVITGVNQNGQIRWYYTQSTGEFRIKGEGSLYGYNPPLNTYTPWNYYRTKIKSVVIEEGITNVGKFNFWWCTELERVELPSTVKSIDESAFQDCGKLVEVVFPDSLESIGISAFSQCIGLKEIELPSKVTTLGENAFSYCSSLKSISLPDSISEIDSYVFDHCEALEEIKWPSKTIEIPAYAFSSCSSLTSFEVPESVKTINYNAFENCTALENVQLHEGLEHIEYECFCGCVNLDGVEIPSTVLSIEAGSFTGCSSLTSVEIPEGIDVLTDSCFKDCINLKSVKVPDTVTNIEPYVFSGCTSLTDVEIPDTVTKIGEYAFYQTKVSEVTIPAGTVSVGAYAFAENSNLKKVVIENPVCELGKAFVDAEGPVIYGYENSTAKAYAEENKLSFVSLGNPPIANCTVTFAPCDYTYNGEAKTPVVKISGLTEGTDFTVEYKDNINAGEASAIITGVGIYTGTKTVAFNIEPKSLTRVNADIVLSYTSTSYSKKPAEPKVNIEGLEEGKDFVVIYTNNTAVGTATAKAAGIGNYNGYKIASFYIEPADIQYSPAKLEFESVVYAGDDTPKPAVITEDLILGTDYSVTYTLPESGIGTAKVQLTGMGSYYGTQYLKYKIECPHEFTKATCTSAMVCKKCGESAGYALGHDWTDATCEKARTCTRCGITQGYALGHDWIDATCTTAMKCRRCGVESGSALGHYYNMMWTLDKKATMSEDGSKSHHCTRCGYKKDITVIPRIESVTLSEDKIVYTGEYMSPPSILVKDREGTELYLGNHYTVEGNSNKKDVGKYELTINFTGNYSGTQTFYYTVVPKKPSSAKAQLYGYDDIQFTWNKSVGASGYRVYYKKSGADGYTFLKSTTGTSVKKSNLSDGKKYYFKVIPYYKDEDGKQYYSSGEYKTSSVYTLKKVSKPKTSKNGTKVKVKWTGISGESGYQIYKMTKSNGKYKMINSYTTTSTYKNISATKNKTYYYKVRAYKKVTIDGKSKKIYGPWSDIKSYKRT